MPRLAGLQTLRAMAALMVLTGHVLAEAEHYFARDLPSTGLPWSRGVDLFFVISGFIIALSAARMQGQPLTFLWRRFWRVVPLYWLFTTLTVVALMVPGALKDTQPDLGQIVSSYLFLPHARPDGRIAPVLSLGWTLNYEMAFYALTALALCLSRPFVFVSLALVALSLAGLGIAGPSQGAFVAFYTNPLMLEFLFGIAVARAYSFGWRLSGRGMVACAGAGVFLLLLLHGTGLPRFLAAGVPAMLIVAAVTLRDGAPTGSRATSAAGRWPLQRIGDASYALYLSHRFVLRALTLLVLPLMPQTQAGALVFVVGAGAAALVGALLVHSYVERPLLAAAPRHRARRVAA